MPSKLIKLLPLQKWDFVTDLELRKVVTTDYRELRKVVKVNAYKSAMILCGSILEAVLIANLSTPDAANKYRNEYKKELDKVKMPEWGLEDLINISKKLEYLNDDTQRQAQVVQKFRNYIHPNKAHQMAVKVDANTVGAAISLLHVVIKPLKPKDGGKKPSLIPEEHLLRKLKSNKCTPEELEAAKKIIAWANQLGLKPVWGKNWIYRPRLHSNGYTYIPVIIRPDGNAQISFSKYKGKPGYFRDKQGRDELRQRLNNDAVGGIIRPARIDGVASFRLKVIAHEPNLTNFLSILDWVVTTIK